MYWKQWLQTLLGLVILLGILEILLPPGELGKFSKLVLGLVLMLAVLQPLTIILNQDIRDLDLSWISEDSPDFSVQARGEKMQLAATTPFLQHDQSPLASQLEDILRDLDYIDNVEVRMPDSGRGTTLLQIFVQPFAASSAGEIADIVASLINVPVNQISVERWTE